MRSNPTTNSAGSITNTTRPAYGFLSRPTESSARRKRKSRPLAVVSATPIREMGFRRAAETVGRIRDDDYDNLFFRVECLIN
jgi:hypothetical protein